MSNHPDSITRRFQLENSLNEKYQDTIITQEQNHKMDLKGRYRIEITKLHHPKDEFAK